jgi:hypothetical protein
MSSAFYPLGMKSYNNHVPQGGYKTWKGTGVLSNPVGVTASHIRPLTNLDPGNIFPTGFGLARPLKQYRKGRVIPYTGPLIIKNANNEIETIESSLIQYNLNRLVKSSKGQSLGGGFGGRGLINQMMDTPGSYLVKQNSYNEINNTSELNNTCVTCQGVGIIDNYYPNNTYLTNNPAVSTTNLPLCCNEQRKAIRRVLPASTNLKKNYYTTLQQYRQNRCQTYNQRVFNFQSNTLLNNADSTTNSYNDDVEIVSKFSKPGDPLSYLNLYFANCYPNGEILETSEVYLIDSFILILKNKNLLTTQQIDDFYKEKIITLSQLNNYIQTVLPEENKKEILLLLEEFIYNPYYGVPIEGPTNPKGCKLVVYKPNNYQFAQQGAVSSSTRILKLNVDTINTNYATFNKNSEGVKYTPNNLINYTKTDIPFVLKNKSSKCGNPPIFPYQNHKACYLNQEYATPNTPNILNQPVAFTTRQSAFPTNHFGQSPRYALM